MSISKLLLQEISTAKKQALMKKIDQRLKKLNIEFALLSGRVRALDSSVLDSSVERALYIYISQTDPTYDQKALYVNWLVTIFLNKPFTIKPDGGDVIIVDYDKIREDKEKIKAYLNIFHENKSDIKREGYNIDINSYKSVEELYDVVSKFEDEKPDLPEDETELLTNQYFIKNGHAQVVFDDAEYLCIHPITLEASQYYGCTANWCTTYPDMFKQYTDDGILLIFINKKHLNEKSNVKRRHQLHLEFTVDYQSREVEWRDIRDDFYFDETEFNQMNEFFKPYQRMNNLYKFIKTNYGSQFEFFEFEKASTNAYHSSWSMNEDGLLVFEDSAEELVRILNPSGKYNEKFFEALLNGDYWGFFHYDPNDVDYNSIVDEISDDLTKKIIHYIKTQAEESGKFEEDIEINETNVYDIIEEGDFEEVKRAIMFAGARAEEDADANSYTKNVQTKICDNLKTDMDSWEWTDNGIKITTGISVDSSEWDNRFKEVFGVPDLDDFTEKLIENLEVFYPSDYLHSSIDTEYFNDQLLNILYEEVENFE